MLQSVLALALFVHLPPADEEVLAALPAAERTGVSISKSRTGSVWTCIAYYTEDRDGVQTRRLHVVYLEGKVAERRGVWNTPAIPEPNPYPR